VLNAQNARRNGVNSGFQARKKKKVAICRYPGKNIFLPSALQDDLQTRHSPGTAPIFGADMSWIVLFIAGLLEVVWAIGLKYTHGFSRLTPSVITIAAMIVSMALLAWAMKTLPVGTAYAVWTGIGAVGAAITGIILLGESANPMRLASLALIVVGIIGLKLSTH